MTATFNPALTTPKDRIRLRIGDTDLTNVEVQDETIAGYLTLGYTELRAATRLCRDIAARYARVGDLMVDGQRSSTGKIYDHYIALANELENEQRPTTVDQSADPAASPIMVGGIGDRRGAIGDDWPC